MADIFQTHPSTTLERFSADYFRTFSRLLDPNLAPAIRFSEGDRDITRWPPGQTFAFATIVSAGLWACVAAIIYFFA